jgi:hypothetical protein
MGNGVRCEAVTAVKPLAGEGHSSGNRANRKCQDAGVALGKAEKGCRWAAAAAERVEAACVAEETNAAAHAAG